MKESRNFDSPATWYRILTHLAKVEAVPGIVRQTRTQVIQRTSRPGKAGPWISETTLYRRDTFSTYAEAVIGLQRELAISLARVTNHVTEILAEQQAVEEPVRKAAAMTQNP